MRYASSEVNPGYQYLILLLQLLVISFIRFCMLSIVLSISLTGDSAKFLFTRAENSSKSSRLIWWVITSSVSFSRIRLQVISIGFTSGDRPGIANTLQPIASNALLALLLFWIGSPSCKNNLFWGTIMSLNAFGKSFLTILAKRFPISFPKYWVLITKPFLYDIPTRKPATSFFSFSFAWWLNLSLLSRHALFLQWRTSSSRLYLWGKFTWSK